jgi:hypothetical protein
MNELKKKYKLDFGQLRTFINEFDPCGLIALGSPIDEYDYLTHKILGLIHRGEFRDKIKETILFELQDYFGEDIESLEEPGKGSFYKSLDKLLDSVQKFE